MFAFKSPFNVQILALQASWSLGLLWSHKASTIASQLATYTPESPVHRYDTIGDITKATSGLKWTADPWNGKLDVIKHPTFMQDAINHHPDYSGDCDCYGAYWIAALAKSQLALGIHMGICMWDDAGKIKGHACCVYQANGSWWWVSNWHGCEPQKISHPTGWIDAMMADIKKPLVVAGKYMVEKVGMAAHADDTVIFGAAVRLR